MKTLLIFISTLFLFSCGEKKENIYLECTAHSWGEYVHNPYAFITLDFENKVGIYGGKRGNFIKAPLSISDRFYSFKNEIPGWQHTYTINRATLEYERSALNLNDNTTSLRKHRCKKVQSFNKI